MNAHLAYELHASLLLSARHRARDFAAQAVSIYCDSEQSEMARDYAADARKDAWMHLRAAKFAKIVADFREHGMKMGRQVYTACSPVMVIE